MGIKRRELPFKVLREAEEAAAKELRSLLKRVDTNLTFILSKIRVSREESALVGSQEVLKKSTAIQDAKDFYAFGIPKELEEAAKEATTREREVFVLIASGQPTREEGEKAKAAEAADQRRVKVWMDVYRSLETEGKTNRQALTELEKDPKYKRSKELALAALRIWKEAHDKGHEERLAFMETWSKLTKGAREAGIPVPETGEELGAFWDAADKHGKKSS